MNESMCGRMDVTDEVKAPDVGGCPMHTTRADRPVLEEDELVFPKHKRVTTQYSPDPSGVTELHLYYGEKEVSFDDPKLFAFGEGLAQHERFIARDATTWGTGYEWVQVQGLLEQLLEEGILRHADGKEAHSVTNHNGPRPSPLPPAESSVPRTWFDCEAITQELTDHSLEMGYLESIVPIYRVAHIALDTEGRQVGEANVFPKPLRLDIPTEWRTCPHAGSRFQDELPMNVTALKSMRAYWKPMLVMLQRIREAYLRRVPHARRGWNVGTLERLSSLVLTVPAYFLMRRHDRVENGQLHPALSSMYRVTDGVRMTTHYMLFVPVEEPTRDPEAPVTSTDVYDYAERNGLFLSDTGVCAGPKAMIDEFLGVLVNGQPVEGAESMVLDPVIEDVLGNLDAAFDYGFYGLQLHAVVSALWTITPRTYERMWDILEAWPGKPSEAFITFRERLRSKVEFIRTKTFVQTEAWRAARDRAYADMYEQSARALNSNNPGRSLFEALNPAWEAQHHDALQHLLVFLRHRLCPTASATHQGLEQMAACLLDYLRHEQAVVRLVCEIQARVNVLLGRIAPVRLLTASDLHVYYLLQEVERRPPYLVYELEEGLDLRIVVTSQAIEIAQHVSTSTLHEPLPFSQHGAGRSTCDGHGTI